LKQGKIEFGNIIDGLNKKVLLSSLNISNDNLLGTLQMQIVSIDYPKVMIGIRRIETLNRIKPNYDKLSRLSRIINYDGYYVTIISSQDSNILIQ